MTRWIATLSLPLCLLFVACDSEPVGERSGESALVDDVDALEAADADEAGADSDADRRSAKRGRKGPPAERLCADIGCTAEQTAAITQLFARNRPAKGDREAAKEKGAERRMALAEAFRSGTLSADAIGQHRPAKSGSKRAETLVELHALLTADQREQVADMIAERGPRLFSGKGKHGGKGKRDHEGKRGAKGERGHEGKRGAKHHDGDESGAHGGRLAAKSGPKSGKRIERLCSKVECTDEQRTILLAQAAELHPAPKGDREARKAERKAANAALATAFRGDSFSAADLEGFGADAKAKHEAKRGAKSAMLIALQEVLTDEQRAVVADMIAERGLSSVVGGKRGKHSKRGHHGNRGPDGKRGRGKHRGDTSESASDHA